MNTPVFAKHSLFLYDLYHNETQFYHYFKNRRSSGRSPASGPPVHSPNHDKEEVQVALSFPVADPRRKQERAKIRKMENFNHNKAVLATNEGGLKVSQRPTANTNPTMYLPCKECNDFFLKNELSRHAITCLSRSHGETKKTG